MEQIGYQSHTQEQIDALFEREEEHDQTVLGEYISHYGVPFQEYSSSHGEALREGQRRSIESMMGFLDDIEKRTPFEAQVERDALEMRIADANFSELLAMLGVQGGSEGSAQIQAALADYSATLRYTLDQLNTNPSAFLARKRAELQQALYTGQQLGALFQGMPDNDIFALQMKNELGKTISSYIMADIFQRQEEGSLEGGITGMLQALGDAVTAVKGATTSSRIRRAIDDWFEEMVESITTQRGRGTAGPDYTAHAFQERG